MHPKSCLRYSLARPENQPGGIEILESRIAPATLTVTTLSDRGGAAGVPGSLRYEIIQADAASGASTIVFHAGLRGTIALKSDMHAISNDVTITAPGVTINGEGKFQGLSITGGSAVSISGLEITNCKAVDNGSAAIGGGVYINDSGGTITISNSVITGNHAVGAAGSGAAGENAEGGGIAILNGTVVLQGSTVSKNSALGGAGATGGYAGGNAYGGGIFNAGTLTVESLAVHKGARTVQQSSKITGNSAVGGIGGAATNYSYTVATGAIQGTFGGAGGYGIGGGIASSGGSVTIQQSVISGNSAKGGAGRIGGKTYNGANGSNFFVSQGTANAPGDGASAGSGYYGGAGGKAQGAGVAAVSGGSLTITASTVSGNTATGGIGGNGAAGGKGGNGGVGGSFQGMVYPAGAGGNGGNGANGGNGGMGSGGGVYCGGLLTIQTSTISGNSAVSGKAGKAGALGAAGTGSTAGTAGTAGTSGSYLGSRGGGIDSEQSTIALSLVTVAKNSAFNGGGVSVYQDNEASIHNSTIGFNKTLPAGAGAGLFIVLDSGSDPVNVVSTIIAQNTGTNVDGTLGANSSNDILSGIVLKPALAFHDGGTTETLLPLSSLAPIPNNSTTNPDFLSADQNGKPFGSTIEIGAVDTTT